MKNLDLAKYILQHLSSQGMTQVCLCAGSRNSPFVEVLDAQDAIKVFYFFEEREAAFFAYQQIKEHGRLTAVITTSGTAVAELLPATIESFYKQIPLLIISADRPKHFRNSGAPQSIEQVDIFSSYATCTDIDSLDFDLPQLRPYTPNHINVCFAEPLLSGENTTWSPRLGTFTQPITSITKTNAPLIKNPIVIVGDISSTSEMEQVKKILSGIRAPILLEAISNLRGKYNSPFILRANDLNIEAFLKNGWIESVVRLGGVPTTSLWRRLEEKYKHIPVFNFSALTFSGLGRPSQQFSYMPLELQNENTECMLDMDKKMHEKVLSLFDIYPQSEASYMHRLQQAIQRDDTVYLGNSLPIREWDLFTPVDKSVFRVGSNRGANGIDGQLSSFIGFAHPGKKNIGIFGDLTTMYGMNGPWILEQMPKNQIHNFVVINNSGGQIFSRMYESKSYLNTHSFDFSSLANFWKLEYVKCDDSVVVLPKNNALIEIVPDKEQSDVFWKDLRS